MIEASKITSVIPSKFKIIAGIVIFLMIFILVWKIYQKLRKPANAKYIEGGGAIPQGWSPDNIAKQIYDATAGITQSTDTKDEAYKRFNELNDNQMIAVYNYWNDKYSTKSSYFTKMGTLTNTVSGELGYVAILGTNQQDVILANLKRLNLP